MPDLTSTLSSAIINTFLGLWYLIPVLIIIGFIKSAYFKGKFGEFIVNRAISKKLDKTEYHLVKNVTLPTDDGTTQVDHIIVSRYGIFVIETKNMKGWIFGSERQKMWTQKIYKHSNKFQNPLHQNYKHIKTLSNLLEVEVSKFHSLVVFTGDSTFKAEMPENVLNVGYINYIKSKGSVLFSIPEVEALLEKIELFRFKRSRETNRNHIKHLKQKHQ